MAGARTAAKLFLNERHIEVPGVKADAVFNEVSKMKARGTDNGVGFQMRDHHAAHEPTAGGASSPGTPRSASRCDHRDGRAADRALRRPAAIQAQANVPRALATCRAAPNCKTFVVWGFTDKYSWIRCSFPGMGSATVMDSVYRRQPAYDALNKHLEAGTCGGRRSPRSISRDHPHSPDGLSYLS